MAVPVHFHYWVYSQFASAIIAKLFHLTALPLTLHLSSYPNSHVRNHNQIIYVILYFKQAGAVYMHVELTINQS